MGQFERDKALNKAGKCHLVRVGVTLLQVVSSEEEGGG